MRRKCTIRAAVPLMLGVALEIYVVSLTVLGDPRPAVGIALAVALLFAALGSRCPGYAGWGRRRDASSRGAQGRPALRNAGVSQRSPA
jgi:hypothetical protein